MAVPFVKGDPRINRNGRPKNPIIQQFRDALKQIEEEKGCSLLSHFIKQAYRDNHVLTEAIKKLLPDLTQAENLNTNIHEAGASVNELARDIANRISGKNKDTQSGSGTTNTTNSLQG